MKQYDMDYDTPTSGLMKSEPITNDNQEGGIQVEVTKTDADSFYNPDTDDEIPEFLIWLIIMISICFFGYILSLVF